VNAAASTLTRTLATNTVGTFKLTYTAVDNLGNTRSKDCWYEVTYKFRGFPKPIENDELNISTAGQGVGVKWRITDANGVAILDANTFVEVTTSGAKTCNLIPEFAVQDEQFKGASGNPQNLGGGNYQFNWAVPKSYANTCRTMALRLRGSGLQIPAPGIPSRRYQFANFQFKAK
jgi:hypothetical protein